RLVLRADAEPLTPPSDATASAMRCRFIVVFSSVARAGADRQLPSARCQEGRSLGLHLAGHQRVRLRAQDRAVIALVEAHHRIDAGGIGDGLRGDRHVEADALYGPWNRRESEGARQRRAAAEEG